jgi:hypothetical protein
MLLFLLQEQEAAAGNRILFSHTFSGPEKERYVYAKQTWLKRNPLAHGHAASCCFLLRDTKTFVSLGFGFKLNPA